MRRLLLSHLKRTLKHDDGISFVELMLVSVFAVFVLALAYQLVQFAQAGQVTTNRDAATTGDTGVVLDIMDRYLSQSTQLQIIDDYTFTVMVPSKTGGEDYPATFSANSDGTLTLTREMNGASETLVLSDNNANRASATPFLRLYYEVGKLLPAGDTSMNIEEVRAVRVVIKAYTPGAKSSSNYLSSSRTVYMRNR